MHKLTALALLAFVSLFAVVLGGGCSRPPADNTQAGLPPPPPTEQPPVVAPGNVMAENENGEVVEGQVPYPEREGVRKGIHAATPKPKPEPPAPAIKWIKGYDEGMAAAKEANKRVLVEFYNAKIAPSADMDSKTFGEPGVRRVAAKYVCVRIDVERDKTTPKKLKVQMVPAVVLLRPDGKEIDRVERFMDPMPMIKMLKDGLAG